MSLEAENTALKARVAELERERDHNASLVDEGDNLTMQESARADLLAEVLKNCDLEIHRLRAQLEAAKLKLGYYAEGVDLQGIAAKVNKDAVERDALRYGPGIENLRRAVAQALSAAPAREDGVRGALEKVADEAQRYCHGCDVMDERDLEKALGDYRQALAAPAPAKVCQTCGDEKYVFHELDLSKPCPDCAKEGKP